MQIVQIISDTLENNCINSLKIVKSTHRLQLFPQSAKFFLILKRPSILKMKYKCNNLL